MAIKIKRSTGNLAPESLAAGQLAYSEGSSNGGTLYYGEIGGTVREIAGRKYVDKLNGIEAGAQVNTVTSVAGRTGAVTIATSDVSGFNTAVDARITSTKITTELGYTPESSSNKGQANGYASLDSSGLVPSSQLPSYVDDVLEYSNLAGFPGTGTSGKIYVAIDTGKTYRWSGSAYVEISASPGSTDAVIEGSTNLYYTDARARSALSASQNMSYNSSTGAFTGPDLTGYALSSSLSSYATTASLATVATTGAYSDLTGKPSLFSGAYADLTGKPSLFSGAYADLTGKPTSITSFGITDGTTGQVLTTNGSGVFTFTTPSSGGIASVSADTTPSLGGDLTVNGKKIVSASNGNIVIQPNGTGVISLASSSGTTFGDGAATAYAGSNGAYDLIFKANIVNDSGGAISLKSGSSGNVELYPQGSGKVVASTSTTQLGTGSAAATLTTNGAYGLTLNTNNGTTTGSIVLATGANGNMTLACNGTGLINLNSPTFAVISSTAAASLTARQTVTASSTITNISLGIQKHRTDIAYTSMTDEPVVTSYSVRDSSNTNRAFGRFIANYYGTGTDPIYQFRTSTDNFSTSKTITTFAAAGILTGDGNNNAFVSTHGTGSLILATNSSSGSPSNSATIQVNNGTNATISLSPNGTGKVSISGIAYPNADGTSGQFLSTNGSGVLSFTSDVDDGTF